MRAVRPGLLASLGFQGLSGVAGGLGLVGDPTGAALGLPLGWLEGSPFDDYFLPGLFLLVGLGAVPLVVLFGVWSGRRWGPPAALGVGIVLVAWILIEIAVVGFQSQPPLQVTYGLLGVLITALAIPLVLRLSPAGSAGIAD